MLLATPIPSSIGKTMAINLVVFLLSFLCACSLSAAYVFLSIDCGSSTSYKDYFGITWTGDDAYVQTGESRSTGNSDNDVAMNTLRVFKSHTRNCYNIPGEQGTKLLLRASFYYGNYDTMSAPPTFDLSFDGNFWDTVVTTIDTVIYREVTYIPKSKNISLCLGKKYSDQFPFISAIEVRTLASNIYTLEDASKYPLLLNRRTDYTWGSTNMVIRYSDDAYDRIWTRFSYSTVSNNGWVDLNLSSNAGTVDLSKTADNPPEKLFDYAVQTANTSTKFVLDVSTLPSTKVEVYINMYFTEYLKSSETRSFDIYLDNQSIAKDFSPVFGVATEISTINVNASSASNFYLAATSTSTLPPLIVGLELFVIGTTPPANGTNTNDVSGLASLQNAFSVLQVWSGDPCLPVEYPWDWLKCTNDTTPRVTSLLLSDSSLSGKLPDFSSLDAIQSIDLSNNDIGGSIPDFLASFSNLTYLNLANNNFSGQIPQWLYQKNNLKFDISGNQYLCNGTSCQKKSSNSGTKKWLAGVLGGIIPPLVVAAVLGGFRSWRNRRKEKANVDTSNSAAAEEGGSSAPGKCWNWRKKLNSKPSGGGAGKPGKPKPSGLQSGTDDPKLGTRVTKIISKESVAPTTSLVENMLGVQQTTVDQNDYTTAET